MCIVLVRYKYTTRFRAKEIYRFEFLILFGPFLGVRLNQNILLKEK